MASRKLESIGVISRHIISIPGSGINAKAPYQHRRQTGLIKPLSFPRLRTIISKRISRDARPQGLIYADLPPSRIIRNASMYYSKNFYIRDLGKSSIANITLNAALSLPVIAGCRKVPANITRPKEAGTSLGLNNLACSLAQGQPRCQGSYMHMHTIPFVSGIDYKKTYVNPSPLEVGSGWHSPDMISSQPGLQAFTTSDLGYRLLFPSTESPRRYSSRDLPAGSGKHVPQIPRDEVIYQQPLNQIHQLQIGQKMLAITGVFARGLLLSDRTPKMMISIKDMPVINHTSQKEVVVIRGRPVVLTAPASIDGIRRKEPDPIREKGFSLRPRSQPMDLDEVTMASRYERFPAVPIAFAADQVKNQSLALIYRKSPSMAPPGQPYEAVYPAEKEFAESKRLPIEPETIQVHPPPALDLNRISDQVCSIIERKLRTEKERRGLYG